MMYTLHYVLSEINFWRKKLYLTYPHFSLDSLWHGSLHLSRHSYLHLPRHGSLRLSPFFFPLMFTFALSATWIFTIGSTFSWHYRLFTWSVTKNLRNIREIFAKNLRNICKIFAKKLQKIRKKLTNGLFTWSVAKNSRKICEIFAKYLQKICEKFTKNSQKNCEKLKFAKYWQKIREKVQKNSRMLIFRKFFANFSRIFREFFANFSQIFCEYFANFLQNFRDRPREESVSPSKKNLNSYYSLGDLTTWS